ncbi:MAG TPA: glycoside hydrolase family 3 N-terminal domain-containing protein [Terriglobales bacterium]|nr:glycoside hydrolase family 3 N-terminal domain-containing protein [Terriglobales bacterium]
MAKDKDRKAKFQVYGPVRLDREGEKWAQKTLKKLTLEEKVGQVLMVWSRAEFLNVNSAEFLRLRDITRKYHLGGFGLTVPTDGPFLLRSQPYEAAVMTNQLQRESELPLLIGADFERGLSMRLQGVTVFPHAMAFGADGNVADSESAGRITGIEARAVGVHWNWFPDTDVNSNPVNPIINTRSFGEDPQQVGAMAAAYIRGAHEAGMLVTAKHFPGHGDTATDSHLGLATVNGDIARLDKVELPPFEEAIKAGVDAIMVAHVTVPALEPDPNKVATTSSAVVTDLLKKKMGFRGLVVTDALDMNALMRIYAHTPNPSGAAAVATMKAGNDIVLIPGDLDGAYKALLQAVKSGEIAESQLNTSVLKVLRAKASLGLNKARLVDLDKVAELVGQPGNVVYGQRIADSAVTLVRDNGHVLPLKRVSTGTAGYVNPYTKMSETRNRVVAIVFTDDVRMEHGRVFERELRARVPDAKVFFVDPRIAGALTPQIAAAVDQAEAVLVPVYLAPVAGKKTQISGGEVKNTVSLAGDTAALMQAILEHAAERTAVIAMGNPYMAADFPAVQNYLCTYSFVSVSELSAIRALFGEIPIRGRLPVTIPGIAQRGAGIDRAQQARQGGMKSNVHKKSVSRLQVPAQRTNPHGISSHSTP